MEQAQSYHHPLNARQGQVMPQSPYTTTRLPATKGVGIGYSKSLKAPAATVTPTSTPPIRVSPSTRQTISPSPLATQAQKQFYEDSTWRMYDRIQASRPISLKQILIPPLRPASSMSARPRYSHQRSSSRNDCSSPEDQHHNPEEDDELIFDLEL